MLLVLIVTLALAGIAFALAARAVALPRLRTGESLGQIDSYGYAGRSDDPDWGAGTASAMHRLASRVGALVFRDRLEEQEQETQKLLLAAGAWNTSPATFMGYRVLASVAAGAAFVWLTASGGSSPMVVMAGGPYAALMAWVAPGFVLKRRAGARLERIELELPELIDLLVVTLEAGLGFTASLQRAGERMQGPLGDEIRLTLREHNLGLALDGALRKMLDRCEAPAVRAFVRAVTQGEALGISIGQVMRDLAGDLRNRRRQIVQEKAQRAPIKLLFPLAFLILPVIFVVVLFPGMYEIVKTLGGS